MIQDIQQQVESYHNWLKEKTSLRQIKDWIEITTPYLDRHNDYIQIYAKKNSEGFLLTDDGYTITDLEQSGYNLNTSNRMNILKMMTNGFGVESDGTVLRVQATSENFSLCKHNLVQAILAVNDMFYLATPGSPSVFYDEVVAWLEAARIRYTPKILFIGQTGYNHMFHFVIPKSNRSPERILQTISKPSRTTVSPVVLSWVDTKATRPPESRAYVMLNDSVQAIPRGVTGALQNYDMRPIRWSRRDEEARAELAA